MSLVQQAKRGTKAGVQPYKGMVDGLVRCYNEEGLPGMLSFADVLNGC